MRYSRILCLLLWLCASCRKELSLETPGLSLCEYNPYFPGSIFNYRYTSATDTFDYTVEIRRDTVINGKTYAILNNGADSLNFQYVRCENGAYYLFQPGFSDQNYSIEDGERLFLYDYYKAGQQWSDTVTVMYYGSYVVGLLQYKILARDTTMTIAGKSYKNVIAVQQSSALYITGVVYPLGVLGTYYYAQGIGYIESDRPTDTVRLTGYFIQ